MRKFEIVSKFESENPKLPKRATKGSAGYDFASIKDYAIEPGKIVLIETGIKVKMPESEVLLIFPRSSLALKKSLVLTNGVGVIDSDYYNTKETEGHIMFPFMNIGTEPVQVLKGERVAQGIFADYKITEDDTANRERKGGFGSSDKKDKTTNLSNTKKPRG